MCDKVSGLIRIYDRTKYLALFGSENYLSIFNIIKYLVILNISCVVSHDYANIKIDSDNDLPLEKTLNAHDFIILIKSVCNEN